MISIFIDIFRSHDLKGWMKAAWVVGVLVFPLFGILLYFIVCGDRMRAHQIVDSVAWDRGSKADELSRLAELRDRGAISPDEYERLKAELLDRATTG